MFGQIEFDAMPNFRVQDGLENIAACEGILEAEDQFVGWTWSQVTFGEENAVYAIPQDTGPMAMIYRADLYEAAGIPVPTTWEEYEAAAVQIRAQGGYINNFSQSDINAFAGLVWQAGGEWFTNDADGWTVDLTGAETTQVAEYWQGLIDNDLVAVYPPWTDEWNAAYNSSEIWTKMPPTRSSPWKMLFPSMRKSGADSSTVGVSNNVGSTGCGDCSTSTGSGFFISTMPGRNVKPQVR